MSLPGPRTTSRPPPPSHCIGGFEGSGLLAPPLLLVSPYIPLSRLILNETRFTPYSHSSCSAASLTMREKRGKKGGGEKARQYRLGCQASRPGAGERKSATRKASKGSGKCALWTLSKSPLDARGPDYYKSPWLHNLLPKVRTLFTSF